MSNIIKSKEELIILRDVIHYVDINNISKRYVEQTLKLLIPKIDNQSLIKYSIREKGYHTACFIPENNALLMSIDKMKEWLQKNSEEFVEMYKVKDIDMIKKYMFLFIFVHEIEHSYQYLMAKGIVDSPNKNIEYGYKGIFDLFERKQTIFPNLINDVRRFISLTLYNFKVNNYILERNANVECTDLLCNLALFMDREDLYNSFNSMRNDFLKLGYVNSSKGSLEETYRNILMYDKYKKFYNDLDLSNKDKIRYGLKVDEDVRKLLLKG